MERTESSRSLESEKYSPWHRSSDIKCMSTFELLQRLSLLLFLSQNDLSIADDQRNINVNFDEYNDKDDNNNYHNSENYWNNNVLGETNCVRSSRLRRMVVRCGLDAFYNSSHLWQEHFGISNKRHVNTNECDITSNTEDKFVCEYYSQMTCVEVQQMCTEAIKCVAETSMTYALLLELLFAQLLPQLHATHKKKACLEEYAQEVEELSIAQKVLYVLLQTCSVLSFSKTTITIKSTENNCIERKDDNKYNITSNSEAEYLAVPLIDVTNKSTWPYSKSDTSTKHFSLKRQRFEIPVWQEASNTLAINNNNNTSKIRSCKIGKCIHVNRKKNEIWSHAVRLTPAVMSLIESSSYLQRQLCWEEEDNIFVKNMWHIYADQKLIARGALLPSMQSSLTEPTKYKSSWELESLMNKADSEIKISKLHSGNRMNVQSQCELISANKLAKISYYPSRELRESEYTSEVLRKHIKVNRQCRSSVKNKSKLEYYRQSEKQYNEANIITNHFDFGNLIRCEGRSSNKLVLNKNRALKNTMKTSRANDKNNCEHNQEFSLLREHVTQETTNVNVGFSRNDDDKEIESLFVDSDDDVYNSDKNIDNHDNNDDDDNNNSNENEKERKSTIKTKNCLECVQESNSKLQIDQNALMKKQSELSHQEELLEIPSPEKWGKRTTISSTTSTGRSKTKVESLTPMTFAFFRYTIPEQVCTCLYIAMHHCLFGTPDPYLFTEHYEQNFVTCEEMEGNNNNYEELLLTNICERHFMRCPQIRLKDKFMRCFQSRCHVKCVNNNCDEDDKKTNSSFAERKLPANGVSALLYRACECGSLYLRLEHLCKLADRVEEAKANMFQKKKKKNNNYNMKNNNINQNVENFSCENVEGDDKRAKCIGTIIKAALESLRVGLRSLQHNILNSRDDCNSNDACNLLEKKQHECGSHLHGFTCKELLTFWHERILMLHQQLQQVALVFYLCDDSWESDLASSACENENTAKISEHTSKKVCISSLCKLLSSSKLLLERLHKLHKLTLMNKRHLAMNISISHSDRNCLHQNCDAENSKSRYCVGTCSSTTCNNSKINSVTKRFDLFEYIYEYSFRPFNAMILEWLRAGHVHDPNNEFFISMIKIPPAKGNSPKILEESKEMSPSLLVEQGVSSINTQHTRFSKIRHLHLRKNKLECEKESWVVSLDKIPHFISEKAAYALFDAGNTARVLYTALRSVVHYCEKERQVFKGNNSELCVEGKPHKRENVNEEIITEESKNKREMEQIISISQLLFNCLTHEPVNQTSKTNADDANSVKDKRIVCNTNTIQLEKCELGNLETKILSPVIHFDAHNGTVAYWQNYFTSCIQVVKQYSQLNEIEYFEQNKKFMNYSEVKSYIINKESPLCALQRALFGDLHTENVNVSTDGLPIAKCPFSCISHTEQHSNEEQDSCINSSTVCSECANEHTPLAKAESAEPKQSQNKTLSLTEIKDYSNCKASNSEPPLEITCCTCTGLDRETQDKQSSKQENDEEIVNDNNKKRKEDICDERTENLVCCNEMQKVHCEVEGMKLESSTHMFDQNIGSTTNKVNLAYHKKNITNDNGVIDSVDMNDNINNRQDNLSEVNDSTMYQLADINDEQFHMKRVGPSTIHIKAEADRTSALATFRKDKLLWEKCDVTSKSYWQYCSLVAKRTLREKNYQQYRQTGKVCNAKDDEESKTNMSIANADYEEYRELIGDKLSENWWSIAESNNALNNGDSVKEIVWHVADDANNEIYRETTSHDNSAMNVALEENSHKRCNTQTHLYDYKNGLPTYNESTTNMELGNQVSSSEQYYHTLAMCSIRFYTHCALQFLLLPQVGELHQLYTKILDVCLLQNSRYALYLTNQTWYESIVHLIEVELDKVLEKVKCSFSIKNEINITQSKETAVNMWFKQKNPAEEENYSLSNNLLTVFNKLFSNMWSEAGESNSIIDKCTTIWWEAEQKNTKESESSSELIGHYQHANVFAKPTQLEREEELEEEQEEQEREKRQRHVPILPELMKRESIKVQSPEVKRINDVWQFILSLELHTSFHSPVLHAVPFLPRAMPRYGHIFRTLVFWSTVNIVFSSHWRTILQTNVREVFFFHSMTFNVMRQLQHFVWSNLCTLSESFRESIALNSKQLSAFTTMSQFDEYHELFLQLCELTCFLPSKKEDTSTNESDSNKLKLLEKWQRQNEQQPQNEEQESEKQSERERREMQICIWENIHKMLTSVHAVHDAVHTSKCAISVLEEKCLLKEKELKEKEGFFETFQQKEYNREHENHSEEELEYQSSIAISHYTKEPKQSRSEQKRQRKHESNNEIKEELERELNSKNEIKSITSSLDTINKDRTTAQSTMVEEIYILQPKNITAEKEETCCNATQSEFVVNQTRAVISIKENRRKGRKSKKRNKKWKTQENKLYKDQVITSNDNHIDEKSDYFTLLNAKQDFSIEELQQQISTLRQEIKSAKNALVEVRKAQRRYVHDTVTWHIRAFATSIHLLSYSIARYVELHDNLLCSSKLKQSFLALIALLDETADAMDVKW